MARARLWLKVTVSLALLAVLAAGAAMLAIKAFFPEPKARAFVLEKARKQLGREVRLARIDAGLTGLHLQGLEISEHPGFAAGTFLSVETFSLRPSWKALLRQKLVIASASADGLVVSVVRNADGSFNYDTLASSAPAAAPAAKPAGDAPAEFNVRHLRVARGAAAYVDKAAGTSWSASGLTLRLDDFSLAEPFDLEASARVKGKAGERPVDAALAFEGTVHPARGDRAKFKVDVRRLSAEQEGLSLTAKGKLSGLDAPVAELDAALTAAGKTLLDAKGDISVSSPAAGGARLIDVDLELKTSGLDTTLIAKWLPSAGVPALAIPAGTASLEGRYEGTTAALKSFKVAWADGKIEGSGAARGLGGAAPVYEGRAKFGVDVPEIRAGRYPWLQLPPKAFIPAMRLDGEAAYDAGEVKLSSLEAKFKQGTASASGVVRGLGKAKLVPDLVLRFAVDVPSFKVSELPVALTAFPRDYKVPAMRVDGGARVKGDDLVFEKAVIKGKSGTLRLDGVIAKALAGTPEPALDVTADLELPALTNKDLPFPGVPPGLELPPSRWDVDLSYTPRAVRLRRFAVKIGNNKLSAEGGISDPAGRGAFDLIIKCKRFVLQELTRLTPQTRDLMLTGSGRFSLALAGHKERPVFNGKLEFSDFGATVAGLPLSEFSGMVNLEVDQINVRIPKGKVADGALDMSLTIIDYAKVPKIELRAELDRFDLGKYLAAKKKLDADAETARAEKAAKSGEPPDGKPRPAFRTSGDVEIGFLIHPNVQLRKVAAKWDLWGVTPDMKKLNGTARIDTGEGKLHAIGDMALQSRIVKVLLYPFLIAQRIKFGADLNNISVEGIAGDYAFKDGLMTLRRSELDAGQAAQVSTVGTINLPSEALDLVVSAQVGELPGVDVGVTGTLADPKTQVHYGKILKNAGENLGETGKKLLEGILKGR